MRAGPIISDTLSMPQIRVSQGETDASFPLEPKLYAMNGSTRVYSSPDGTDDPDKATLTISGNNMIIAAPYVN